MPVPSLTLPMRSVNGETNPGTSVMPIRATATNQPTFVSSALNGKSLLRFDGTDDRLEFSGGFVPGDFVALLKDPQITKP